MMLNLYFCFQLLDRRHALIDRSDNRSKLLEDSLRYQKFDRDADEVESWIRDKLKITMDESYKVSNITTLCLLILLSNVN